MLRISNRITPRALSFVRYNYTSSAPPTTQESTPTRTSTSTPAEEEASSSLARPQSSQLNLKDLKNNVYAKPAPNRDTTWTESQQARIDVISKYPFRFTQRDLAEQPRPYSAMELIAKEPIRYLKPEEGNIAVCDGNRGNTLQGHPKIFINLDKAQANTCGYCGLRYAKEEFREEIEAKEKL